MHKYKRNRQDRLIEPMMLEYLDQFGMQKQKFESARLNQKE
jgi:hypothetical protein